MRLLGVEPETWAEHDDAFAGAFYLVEMLESIRDELRTIRKGLLTDG